MPASSYPKIEFCLNKELDKEMAFCFLGTSTGGVDFTQSVLKPYPILSKQLADLKDNNEESVKRIIGKYFDEYYDKNIDTLNNHLVNAQKIGT